MTTNKNRNTCLEMNKLNVKDNRDMQDIPIPVSLEFSLTEAQSFLLERANYHKEKGTSDNAIFFRNQSTKALAITERIRSLKPKPDNTKSKYEDVAGMKKESSISKITDGILRANDQNNTKAKVPLKTTSANLSREMLVRVAADAILINISLALTLFLHYLYSNMLANPPLASGSIFNASVTTFSSTFLILTSISINTLYFSGFYNRGRNYQTQYKRQGVLKAVTVSYLLFALVIFFLWDKIDFPRSVLLPSWVLSALTLTAARMFTHRIPFLNKIEERLVAISTKEKSVQRVLVIGGGGYIGSALLQKLLSKGYQVRLLDLLLFGEEPLQTVIDHPNLEIYQDDFRQVQSVLKAAQGVDAIIHLGAIVGDPACAYDEKLTTDTNFLATRMIAEVAQCAGIKRFIFASTCSVYGASDEILDEKSDLNPISLYARSKIASEEELRKMASDHFSPVFMRFGTIYGLSGRTRFDLVVNLLTAKAIFDRKVTIFGGDQWRPFVHVDDAAQAVLLALESSLEVVHSRVFNVGTNAQSYTINQIGNIIQQAIPETEVIQMDDDTDKRNYQVDFSRIHNELGFEPKWTVEMGIEQVKEAISSGKVTDYKDAKYSNFKYLKENYTNLVDNQLAIEQTSPFNNATVELANSMQRSQAEREWASDLVDSKIMESITFGSPVLATPT